MDYSYYTSISGYVPSDKLYYGTYKFSVKVDCSNKLPLGNYYKFDPEVDFRVKNDWRRPEFLVYTSDTNLVDWLIENYPIHKISCPKNEEHYNILKDIKDDVDVIFRERAFYNKYHFKLDCWTPYNWRRQQMSSEMTPERYEQILTFMHNMEDSKITHDIYSRRHEYMINNPTMGGFWGIRPSQFPKVYTNDEQSLMMFKLMFSNDIRIKISKVITL